jgi:hypothetical protein
MRQIKQIQTHTNLMWKLPPIKREKIVSTGQQILYYLEKFIDDGRLAMFNMHLMWHTKYIL